MLGVFELDLTVIGLHTAVCLFPGSSELHKLLSDYVIPLLLLARLFALWGVHILCRSLHNRSSKLRMKRISVNREVVPEAVPLLDKAPQQSTSPHARYAGALMAILLLMYESVTSMNCVRVDDRYVLFEAGYQECGTWWQKWVFPVLGLLLISFPLILVLIRSLWV